MRLAIVAFACGVWLLQRQAELPPLATVWALALLAPALVWARDRAPAPRVLAAVALAALAFGAGFYWAAGRAHLRLADHLDRAWEGRDVEVIGVVASLPQPFERSTRFELDLEDALTPGAGVPRRVALSWWGRPGALPEVHAGERWRLTLRLKRPHGTANPHGFDYEAWLLERGVRATGYVRAHPPARRLSALVHEPRYWIERARERLRARVLAALGPRPYAGVIAALAIGDQRAIPADQWQTFTRTGVNHLMSISGLHVTMVAGLCYLLARVLWRTSARLVGLLAAPRAAAIAGVAGAFAYTLLAGFAIPAQRTLYMVCVVAAALWLGFRSSPSLVLCAALFIVLVLDPWAINAAGFWLSFGAVAAILFVCAHRVRIAGWLDGWMRTQAAVTVALLPLTLALFQQVSLISPVANAFAIPLVSLVVVPLALVGMLLPVDFVLKLAHFAMSVCMFALERLSALDAAVWQQHAPRPWAVIVAVAGVVWIMLPRGVPARWLGFVACLPLFFVAPAGVRPGELHVAVLDVGQGLSVAVRTASRTLLYDTGPAFGPAADSGTRVIAPYLRASGVRALDGLVVSHDDNDHTGGAVSVLHALPVAWLASSLPHDDPLFFLVDGAIRCVAGERWRWDGIDFEFLHPEGASYATAAKDNERSCVLRITAPGGTVLLPGDIEKRGEAALLARGIDLTADVLIAPHQGSRTSSTAAFVEAVRPRAVIFPVGYRNAYGHPHPDVVQRYERAGADVYRTDRDGAVLIALGPEGVLDVRRWRAIHRRYWLDAPRP